MNTVIYDGDCRFCIDKVQGFQRADINHKLEFIARQDPSTEERFPEIVGVPLDDGIVVIDAQHQLHVAADGIYRIAQELPKLPWRLYVATYPLPLFKQIYQIGYRIIAANRKRLGKTCINNVCSITDAKR
jgi:predicted DCC family thiol-disulfide oxidoreductase YuxK